MEKEELKKITKRVMKKILSERPYGEFFHVLISISEKSIATNKENFEAEDISSIIHKKCSQKEVREIKEHIVKAIKKKLEKKRSYFITTKLMLALWALNEELEPNVLSKREYFCYDYIHSKAYEMDEYDTFLERIALLD